LVQRLPCDLPDDLTELFHARAQLEPILPAHSAVTVSRIDLCQIEIDALELDVIELTNQLNELRRPTVDLVYVRSVRTPPEEVHSRRVHALAMLIERIAISISQISDELENVQDKQTELSGKHGLSSASAFCNAAREELTWPVVTSPDELVERLLKMGKDIEEIEMQYPDLIANEFKQELLVVKRCELRGELTKLRERVDAWRREDFGEPVVGSADQTAAEIEKKQALLRDKRNEMIALVQEHFRSCDAYEERRRQANELEEQIKCGLSEYANNRVRRMPARAPRRGTAT
jgi:hypothetical protein